MKWVFHPPSSLGLQRRGSVRACYPSHVWLSKGMLAETPMRPALFNHGSASLGTPPSRGMHIRRLPEHCPPARNAFGPAIRWLCPGVLVCEAGWWGPSGVPSHPCQRLSTAFGYRMTFGAPHQSLAQRCCGLMVNNHSCTHQASKWQETVLAAFFQHYADAWGASPPALSPSVDCPDTSDSHSACREPH